MLFIYLVILTFWHTNVIYQGPHLQARCISRSSLRTLLWSGPNRENYTGQERRTPVALKSFPNWTEYPESRQRREQNTTLAGLNSRACRYELHHHDGIEKRPLRFLWTTRLLVQTPLAKKQLRYRCKDLRSSSRSCTHASRNVDNPQSAHVQTEPKSCSNFILPRQKTKK
jgi:hypothetical protein